MCLAKMMSGKLDFGLAECGALIKISLNIAEKAKLLSGCWNDFDQKTVITANQDIYFL